MECDHLNKLSIPFQQYNWHLIKTGQLVSEELFNNIMISSLIFTENKYKKLKKKNKKNKKAVCCSCVWLALEPWSCWTQICPAFTKCRCRSASGEANWSGSGEANWSGSASFVIKYVNLNQTTRIKYFDWLKTRSGCGILIYSAWQGLSIDQNYHLIWRYLTTLWANSTETNWPFFYFSHKMGFDLSCKLYERSKPHFLEKIR